MTQVLRVDPAAPDPAVLAEAARCLRDGGLVAFPTETVYGLGAHALDAAAVRRIFEAKGRPSTDPLIVHVAWADRLTDVVAGDLPPAARACAARFWPGPLTLVLPRGPRVPPEVTAGLATVAVRVPAHPVARALLEAAGLPVAAPSANLFSRPSPTTAAHVLEDLEGRVDMVIDGGATPVGVESTVVSLVGPVPEILRPGAVTREMLAEVLPGVRAAGAVDASGATAMPSPGLLKKHYSPRASLTLYEGDTAAVRDLLVRDARLTAGAGLHVGVVAADEDTAALQAVSGPRCHVVSLGSERNLAAVAARLYGALRALDAAGVDMILARGFDGGDGLAVALQDRLRRAAAGRVVRC